MSTVADETPARDRALFCKLRKAGMPQIILQEKRKRAWRMSRRRENSDGARMACAVKHEK